MCGNAGQKTINVVVAVVVVVVDAVIVAVAVDQWIRKVKA